MHPQRPGPPCAGSMDSVRRQRGQRQRAPDHRVGAQAMGAGGTTASTRSFDPPRICLMRIKRGGQGLPEHGPGPSPAAKGRYKWGAS